MNLFIDGNNVFLPDMVDGYIESNLEQLEYIRMFRPEEYEHVKTRVEECNDYWKSLKEIDSKSLKGILVFGSNWSKYWICYNTKDGKIFTYDSDNKCITKRFTDNDLAVLYNDYKRCNIIHRPLVVLVYQEKVLRNSKLKNTITKWYESEEEMLIK